MVTAFVLPIKQIDTECSLGSRILKTPLEFQATFIHHPHAPKYGSHHQIIVIVRVRSALWVQCAHVGRAVSAQTQAEGSFLHANLHVGHLRLLSANSLLQRAPLASVWMKNDGGLNN